MDVLFQAAALLESRKRESIGRRPLSSIRSFAMGSLVAAIHSSTQGVTHSPSSSSVESLNSIGSSPGPAPTTPVASGGAYLPTFCPPSSNRTVPFVTVSTCTTCTSTFIRVCVCSVHFWGGKNCADCNNKWVCVAH